MASRLSRRTVGAGTQPGKEVPAREVLIRALPSSRFTSCFKNTCTLLIALAIPLSFASAVAFFFNPQSSAYTTHLTPPSWTPPFVVWSLLGVSHYALMGIASWLVYIDGGCWKNFNLLGIYFVQLLFNLLWPFLLFGLINLDAALIDVFLLLITTVICAFCFNTSSKAAAYFLLPSVAWVLVAAAFTAHLFILNLNSATT